MTTVPAPICVACRHFIPEEWRCAAFPNRIPEPIVIGDHDHKTPFPGDHGIRFEPVDEESE